MKRATAGDGAENSSEARPSKLPRLWHTVRYLSKKDSGADRDVGKGFASDFIQSTSTSRGNGVIRPGTSKCDTQVANSQLPIQPRFVKRGLKRAGEYLLGPRIGSSPVRSIVQVLARKEGTDEFYTLKILTLEDPEKETQDDRQGKMLMHTEFSLLSLLRDQDGVVHHHGLFKDQALEEQEVPERLDRVEITGRVVKRLCLVLDCLLPHDFSTATSDFVNLQHYVIKEKKLTEREAVLIFYDIVRIVDNLHKKNIVHRDLKLGNMVLNKETRRVTVTNFCLGKHLVSESDLLRDQRGSPAYISPDVLSGKPYRGKPSDMWALGVVLFTMVYGQFPFYDSSPQELFRKIKGAEYTIPHDGRVSDATKLVIRRLLQLDSQMRMTASQVLDALGTIIAQWRALTCTGPLQVVPDIDDEDNEAKSDNTSTASSSSSSSSGSKDSVSAPGMSELERKLLHLQSDMLTEPPKVRTATRRRQAAHTTVTRFNMDAQRLSAAELHWYRHLAELRSPLT
ncbi:serine/threonine-protein kinase 40-like [Babylonia areolata]|uniref:serine/threonine-protein kinase 40-like n=1 Tax=Babylonia areolata TaxID=304850 RepID=UPI003FD26F61